MRRMTIVKGWLAALTLLSLAFFSWTLVALLTGPSANAIYLSDVGPEMTVPGEPLPDEIASIDVLLWGAITASLTAALVAVHVGERHRLKRESEARFVAVGTRGYRRGSQRR